MQKVTAASTADYSPIAWFYDQHWSSHYHPWALAVLEKVLLSRLGEGARILDVCCGNGVLARDLVRRGFGVTGVDASEEMLAYARINAPGADFLFADVREFQLPKQFDAALSTFDSLNHMLSTDELLAVFGRVHAALLDDGLFVFDLNLEESYLKHWRDTCSTIDDEHACFIRGQYDAETRLGRTEVSLFRRNGKWERNDVVILQRFHPADEILVLLRQAGFQNAECLDAIADLGIEGSFGLGRGIFVATK